MHICVVSPSYPTSKTIDFIFVDQLCRAIADKNVKVSIIAPQSITKSLVRNVPIVKKYSKIFTSKGNEIDLYRPLYISFGNIGGWLKNANRTGFNKAVYKAYKRITTPVDVFYGHFWESAYALVDIAMQHKKPLFVASGEERVAFHNAITVDEKVKLKSVVTGVISVSSKNKGECLDAKLAEYSSCEVIPNAIDGGLFTAGDRQIARQKLGISPETFVVIFVGQFTIRKGTLRLDAALKALEDNSIKAIFVGAGNENPTYEGIVYKGRVPHDDLPKYLQAADVFVLPTLNEGCCNAIIEAMACGLPIISSDLAFNHDVLNSKNSILLDPNDISSIADAIRRLKDNDVMREELSKQSLEVARNLTLDKRADRILHFINSKR